MMLPNSFWGDDLLLEQGDELHVEVEELLRETGVELCGCLLANPPVGKVMPVRDSPWWTILQAPKHTT